MAAWAPVVAAYLSPQVTDIGVKNARRGAWVLTLLAMGWEASLYFHAHSPGPLDLIRQ